MDSGSSAVVEGGYPQNNTGAAALLSNIVADVAIPKQCPAGQRSVLLLLDNEPAGMCLITRDYLLWLCCVCVVGGRDLHTYSRALSGIGCAQQDQDIH